jgi:hypothetical protein
LGCFTYRSTNSFSEDKLDSTSLLRINNPKVGPHIIVILTGGFHFKHDRPGVLILDDSTGYELGSFSCLLPRDIVEDYMSRIVEAYSLFECRHYFMI